MINYIRTKWINYKLDIAADIVNNIDLYFAKRIVK